MYDPDEEIRKAESQERVRMQVKEIATQIYCAMIASKGEAIISDKYRNKAIDEAFSLMKDIYEVNLDSDK